MGGTSRQSAVNCLLDLEESGASGRGESGLRLMAFGNARILRLDVLNDEGHKLVDSFKEPRLARIHMFDASPESSVARIGLRPYLNDEIALHPGFRIGLNHGRVVNLW